MAIKIIDAVIFFNEIDALKLRLGVLYHKVDLFLICESNVTFSGLPKPYNFLENQDEFKPWIDKIVYQKFEPDISGFDFTKKDTFYNSASAPWKIEASQRNFLSEFLITQDSNDVAFICDVDEIWNPSIADAIRSNALSHEAARLVMKLHYYYLNCVGVGQKNSNWKFPFYTHISRIKANRDLNQMRGKDALPFVNDGGWHFSYLGGAKKISEKIDAFSHQEINTPEINDLRHLQRCIDLGIDYLQRPDHDLAFHPIDYYPDIIRNEMRKFPHLLKSSLI